MYVGLGKARGAKQKPLKQQSAHTLVATCGYQGLPHGDEVPQLTLRFDWPTGRLHYNGGLASASWDIVLEWGPQLAPGGPAPAGSLKRKRVWLMGPLMLECGSSAGAEVTSPAGRLLWDRAGYTSGASCAGVRYLTCAPSSPFLLTDQSEVVQELGRGSVAHDEVQPAGRSCSCSLTLCKAGTRDTLRPQNYRTWLLTAGCCTRAA